MINDITEVMSLIIIYPLYIFNYFLGLLRTIILNRVIVGVPQGCIVKRELTNLYLHYYEYNVVTSGYVTYRYIDDIVFFKTNKCYGQNIKLNHHPTTLELIKNIDNSKQANILNITINTIALILIFMTKKIIVVLI